MKIAKRQLTNLCKLAQKLEGAGRAILKAGIDYAGRSYPEWEDATAQNRELAMRCAAAAGRVLGIFATE
jgi:hypothetical protein